MNADGLSAADSSAVCGSCFPKKKSRKTFGRVLNQNTPSNPQRAEAAEIMKQARELGIPRTVKSIGGDGFNSSELFKLASEAANGAISGAAWHITSPVSESQKFAADFREAYRSVCGLGIYSCLGIGYSHPRYALS